jgi:hypothetical protein
MSRYITENYSAKDLFSLFGSCSDNYIGEIQDSVVVGDMIRNKSFNVFIFTPPDSYCEFMFIFCSDAKPRDYILIFKKNEKKVFCVPPRYLGLARQHYGDDIPEDNQKRFEEVMEHLLKSNPDFAFHLDIFI